MIVAFSILCLASISYAAPQFFFIVSPESLQNPNQQFIPVIVPFITSNSPQGRSFSSFPNFFFQQMQESLGKQLQAEMVKLKEGSPVADVPAEVTQPKGVPSAPTEVTDEVPATELPQVEESPVMASDLPAVDTGITSNSHETANAELKQPAEEVPQGVVADAVEPSADPAVEPSADPAEDSTVSDAVTEAEAVVDNELLAEMTNEMMGEMINDVASEPIQEVLTDKTIIDDTTEAVIVNVEAEATVGDILDTKSAVETVASVPETSPEVATTGLSSADVSVPETGIEVGSKVTASSKSSALPTKGNDKNLKSAVIDPRSGKSLVSLPNPLAVNFVNGATTFVDPPAVPRTFQEVLSLVDPRFHGFVYENDAPDVIAAKIALFRLQAAALPPLVRKV